MLALRSDLILFLFFLTITIAFGFGWNRQSNSPDATLDSDADLRRRDNPTRPDNITVPVNYGAYTNGAFPPTNFTLPNTGNPPQYASFYAFGGTPVLQDDYANPVMTSGSTTSRVSVFYRWRGTSGGANRSTIYGSAQWGSGQGDVYGSGPYVYHPRSYLNPFCDCLPYGFWPIYWNSGYNVDSRHDYSFDPLRPGGPQSVLLAGLDETRQDAYYFVIADNNTIAGLNTILALPYEQGGCSMWSGNPLYVFNPKELAMSGSRMLQSATGANSRQNITMVPNNILQYYRGSSVALGANVYNSTNSSRATFRNRDYWFRMPFNISLMTGVNRTDQENIKFLDCLNQTIAAAVPIFDPNLGPFPGKDNKPLQVGLGVGLSMLLLVIVLIAYWRYQRQRKKRLRRSHVGSLGNRGGHGQVVMLTRRPAQEQEGEGLPVYTPAARDGEGPPAYTRTSPG